MSIIRTLRPETVPTADRVWAAWVAARLVARCTLVVAGCLAAITSLLVPVPPTVRWAVAAVGLVLAAAALVDVHEHRLPNWLLAVACALAIGGALAAMSWSITVSAALGALLAGGAMLLARLRRGVGTGGVGMGDVKMAFVVGASTGSVELVAAPLAIAVAAFVAAVYGLLAHRHRLPLGPALWLGWVSALFMCSVGWLP